MNPKPRQPISETEALHKLAALCAAAEHCRHDMQRKMAAWDLPEGAPERIIQHLEQGHFIDESRYARAFVRDKSRYNHWGPTRIALELRRKGIPDETIEEALGEIQDDAAADMLKHLLETKLRTTRGSTERERLCKVLRFAVGRGFALQDARKCLAKILDETGKAALENLDETDEDTWH